MFVCVYAGGRLVSKSEEGVVDRDMLSLAPIWTKELGLVLPAASCCASPSVAPAQRNKRVGWGCKFLKDVKRFCLQFFLSLV
jgi:hypothetical protein